MKVNGFGAPMPYQPKSSARNAEQPLAGAVAWTERLSELTKKYDLKDDGVNYLTGKEEKEEKEKQGSWWDAWWKGGYNPYLYQQQMAAASGITLPELLAKGTQLPGDTPAEPLVALTEEQIAALQDKYNIADMEWPSEESKALGDELFALGAITEEQRNFFYGMVRYTGPLFPHAILTPAGETPPPLTTHYERQPGDSMLDILMGELAVQNKNLDYLRSPDSPEKRKQLGQLGEDVNVEDIIGAIEKRMGQYQSAYDLLSQLM